MMDNNSNGMAGVTFATVLIEILHMQIRNYPLTALSHISPQPIVP